MTIKNFIEQFDKEGSIVLLEGKRNVLETDIVKLRELGKLLTIKTKNILFRSGNANGSDQYFSEGVAAVDNSRLQVITPYTGHRNDTNVASDTIPLDTINLSELPDVVYQSRQNKGTRKLIDPYLEGNRDHISIKAAYIIRDTIKAIGTMDIKPAKFGIFYDDLNRPKSGGTGHTMNICIQNKIPIINQTVWFKWLEEIILI